MTGMPQNTAVTSNTRIPDPHNDHNTGDQNGSKLPYITQKIADTYRLNLERIIKASIHHFQHER